ncbi:hypothetical protein PYW08_003111 [Mythimna loreyi]|uniref:Uncharacterized protein n=1 Tax=Mythimna loreyi TaxID=667449 RepID=A0ACC2QQ91_9NEOP|nr:hypothetical protein PYW08_003111 [Mythimna loreyi]
MTRKRSNICRSSNDSRRKRLARSLETAVEREARLAVLREHNAETRRGESSTSRQLRLDTMCTQNALSRSLESAEAREARLESDRERHAEYRASETFTQRETRLCLQRNRTYFARSLEDQDERETRLRADRSQHVLSRSLETDEQREERRAAAQQRYHEMRSGIEAHLSQERDRIQEIRGTWSGEQRAAQVEQDRLRRVINQLSTSDNESTVYDIEEQPWLNKEGSGFIYNVAINYAAHGDIGALEEVCAHCQARKWKGEPKGMCCASGKVRLECMQDPPDLLRVLLNGEHPKSSHFLKNIRAYNSAFQMTSFGAKQIIEGGFMPTVKVQGQVYHQIGSLLPTDNPKFLQIYFVSDFDEQANLRSRYIPNLDSGLVRGLQSMLHNVNPHISNFKVALASVPENERDRFKFVISADRRPIAAHPGRYNAPTTNEVAVLLVDQECDKRDIVLRTHDDRLQRISETHRAYDSLQYPLMFCRGEDGYHFAHYNVDPQTGSPNYNKKTSAMQFYSFLIQLRVNNGSYLHHYRTLFSQFLVDMYAKIETERLVFIRSNQRKLRAENYVHLRDAMQNDANAQDVGRMVILPSTFTGGPRYMHERTQDAFCYVRKFGRPDLFITITTNPKWFEIKAQLLAGQASYDRHDLISRVFHLKLKCVMDLLTKAKVFGAVRCHMYSVEWQKRGLPHAHLLLWLEEKIRPNQIDQVISAELPDPDVDPVLHQIVKSHMVHGPCGTLNPSSPCMKDGRCTKRFPKQFTNETITGEDGYPSYRRRSPAEGGHSTELSVRGQAQPVDNRWIVPYSPVLSRTFQTHINVESCTSVESIKYICKYVNKGSDQATFALQSTDNDEVTKYQSGRYISTSEAVWRILAFSIHDRHPTVMHLDVHLENGQRIYFDPYNVTERLENPRQTTLLAFFKLCEVDQFARSLTYDEVPSYYTYDKQRGVFNRRRRGDFK